MRLSKTLLGLILYATIPVVAGCTGWQRPVPTTKQVDHFLERRATVLSIIYDIPRPMEGTSYLGLISQAQPESLKRCLKHNLDAKTVEPIRKHIKKYGGHYSHGYMPFELELLLSDDLLANTSKAEIAVRINHHYARKLKQAGLHLTDMIDAGTETPDRWVCTRVYSDLGTAPYKDPDDLSTGSIEYTIRQTDYLRGYFMCNIAVCVDMKSQAAHVVIDTFMAIGI